MDVAATFVRGSGQGDEVVGVGGVVAQGRPSRVGHRSCTAGEPHLVQYTGHVLRAHPGKTTAEVHDYHDDATPVLASSLARRAPGYTSLGFPDPRRSR